MVPVSSLKDELAPELWSGCDLVSWAELNCSSGWAGPAAAFCCGASTCTGICSCWSHQTSRLLSGRQLQMSERPPADAHDEWRSLLCYFLLSHSYYYTRRSLQQAVGVAHNLAAPIKARSHTFSLHFPLCLPQTGAFSSFHVVVSLVPTPMKWKIFWAGAALLCCLDKNLSGEQREEHLLIPFAAKRTASLLLLPLIVILCRPAQDTGDSTPWILLCMEKQQQEIQPSWMNEFAFQNQKNNNKKKKLHVLKEMIRFFTHPNRMHSPRQH